MAVWQSPVISQFFEIGREGLGIILSGSDTMGRCAVVLL